MRNIAIWIVLLLTAAGMQLQAQSPEAIKESEVIRILKTLSSDEMEGRRTFTPGIEKAAAFIEEEFERIGLQPLPGLEGFQQRFELYALTPQTLRVEINGLEVPASNCAARGADLELDWQSDGEVEVKYIGADENFRTAFSKLRRADGDQLVVVHPRHKSSFSGISRYLRRPNQVFELGREPSSVFVLAEEEVKDFRVQATFEAERSELANVAGMIPGRRKEEIVVFSAHYDHLGIGRPIAGDSIYNGANDDASGTTAVISLAAFFKQQPQPERSLVFVAFTAEEMGGYGSRYFSQQFDPEHITAMYNIEMIGIEAEKGPASAYITGFDRSSLGNIMQQAVQGSMYNFHPDPYPEQNLFYRSDNATLARLGVPAHTIATTPMKPNQPHYHKPSDEFSTVNTQHITHIIRAIALGAMPVVSGEQTPSRVDKSQVN